uniref:BLUF domain-containing protein n=1 Tax=Fulvivirga sp. TaxID=1931237 RepID=UPI0040499369
MFELVYNSIGNPNLTAEDKTNILNTSRDFNSKNNITGCLLYHNNQFLQILEGDKKVVQDLYLSIKRDKRHSNVNLLVEGSKKERMFSGWSVAFQEFNSDGRAENSFLSNIIVFSE